MAANILLIEDDLSIRVLIAKVLRGSIAKVLRREGHRVAKLRYGTVALALDVVLLGASIDCRRWTAGDVKKFRIDVLQVMAFDLVIVDFVVPNNGVKFVKKIRSLQPRMPIIFMTTHHSDISDKPPSDDVTEVFPRPFEPDVLRSVVHRLIKSTSPGLGGVNLSNRA